MRFLRFIFFACISITLIFIFNNGKGKLPPVGKLLDPVHGYMANAENKYDYKSQVLELPGLHDPVHVYYDTRLVPHIFAENEHDLYMAQGYIVAKHRLWQMEITFRAASGQLSEILGPDLINYDRLQRRLGMAKGAENKLKAIQADPEINGIINAYSDGVNAYIETLKYADYPLEYKLLNFKPTKFEPLHTCNLLMYMSNTLAGFDDDVEYTNAINLIGREDFNLLYPLWPNDLEPIIPKGTPYNFNALQTDTSNAYYTESIYGINNHEQHDEEQSGVGSNNWAIAPAKTKNGNAILCNDPHLQLNLPSIWFEIQLTTPDNNNYGVCFAGAPAIIIGFNNYIAWGSTNSGRDVRDWYRITNADNNNYKYDNSIKPFSKQIEHIKVKDGPEIIDTVFYTHQGPMVYKDFDTAYSDWNSLAMRWAAIDISNDFRVFYLLNKSKNYSDYRTAVSYFECPGQNIVFASITGDIGITQTGKYAVKWPEQGRFVLDGSMPANEWNTYIPFSQNPFMLNPTRGYVSSANQHPTDTLYPYFYMSSDFEFFRNRRINFLLDSMQQITVEDMMLLQGDNYNLIAAESLPILLRAIDAMQLSDSANVIYDSLGTWNYENNAELITPSLFQKFWTTFNTMLWDEFVIPNNTKSLLLPSNYASIQFIKSGLAVNYFDIQNTNKKETFADIALMAIEETTIWKDSLLQLHPDNLQWYKYKNTSIMHLAQIPAFSRTTIKNGGYRNIVNATSERNGPSWRMIVEMDPKQIKAWAIYPGGQSGNPGSKYYDNFITDWANNIYYPLQFYKTEKEAEHNAFFTTIFK
ncbi:MAG: penicillin acylase family protein [Bacteroidetes bacterium]|nr:penicillin acylase family protein [Bacteroidota bacterium]